MAKRVLWLDNDATYVTVYEEAMEAAGYEVTVRKTVAEAMSEIRQAPFDLLILDVMIPTKSELEELDYPPIETDYGTKTGLVFYRRLAGEPNASRMKILVLTVRLDEAVKIEFMAENLPATNFATKFALRDAVDFVNTVDKMMASSL